MVSRTCMNLLSNSRLLASSLGQGPCGFPLRKYASGSVQAKKTRSSTSSKPIHERPALLSEVSSTKVAAKSRSSPKTFAVAAKTKVGTSSSRTVLPREATTHEAPAASHKTTGGLSRTQDAQGTGLSDEEMQLKQADQMMLASQFMPYTDIWGQNVPESLDVTVPYPASFANGAEYASYKDLIRQFWSNRLNSGKNVLSLLALAGEDAIPGINLSEAGWRTKWFQWPFRLFRAQSLKKDAWLTPLRENLLENYKQLNKAVAREDAVKVKELTTAGYQEQALQLMRKMKRPNVVSKLWRFHHEVEPAQILSLRATEGYLGVTPPKIGNRLMVHVLLKFDTEQSLEMYDRRGHPMHVNDLSGISQGPGMVPAVRKRVTEYLIAEKRMWYDGPWVFREQVYPLPPSKAKALKEKEN